ncbi:class I SAM-dependent methyltransferase [Patescibacteria group bacterium]|nr:class I SAM-dependent methyltransferase [Patescibacteria group bacterium]
MNFTALHFIKRVARPFYAPLYNQLHDLLRGARRYRYLYKEIKRVRARRILEVGTWRGDRALSMIRTALHYTPPSEVEYYGFDLFESLNDAQFKSEISKWPPSVDEVKRKLNATGVALQLYKGDTKETLPAALRALPKVDFVFIDGGHSIETIQNDWNCTSQLMHETTVVIFDDYWPHNFNAGAKPVVDAIDTNKYIVEILPIIDKFTHKDFGALEIQFAKVTRR